MVVGKILNGGKTNITKLLHSLTKDKGKFSQGNAKHL